MITMPDFGAAMEEILGYAAQWLEMMDGVNFLGVLAVFTLVIAAIRWIIQTVRNPPSLDI